MAYACPVQQKCHFNFHRWSFCSDSSPIHHFHLGVLRVVGTEKWQISVKQADLPLLPCSNPESGFCSTALNPKDNQGAISAEC